MNDCIITAKELQQVLQTTFVPELIKRCQETNLRYRHVNPSERDDHINTSIKIIFEDLIAAGSKRLNQWESGWNQNLEEFTKTRNINSLIPKYHGKYTYLRWKQQIIKPLSPMFDYDIQCVIVDWLFSNYLSDVNGIYEFGCGPAYHLLRARKFNANAILVGLDWTNASQDIINKIKQTGIERNISGHNFDFCNPDYNISIIPNGGVITIAALEQTGNNFKEFIAYLITQRPKICIHLEPIDDFMDTNHLIDNLSVLYCRKRKYLWGFLPYLQKLQSEGKIEIIVQRRTFSGSQYIEGHSLIVWRPI